MRNLRNYTPSRLRILIECAKIRNRWSKGELNRREHKTRWIPPKVSLNEVSEAISDRESLEIVSSEHQSTIKNPIKT